MKIPFPLPIALFCLAFAGAAHAEKADSAKPTNIEADQMSYDDVKQINTFVGHVVLTRGTLTMRAAKVVVVTDPEGYQYATMYGATGQPATFRQKRDGGPDLWIDGQADRIEYNGKTEIVKLFSNARLRRLEGDKPTDEVQGEFISYDSKTEFYTVNNTAGGTSKPGAGRIRVTIQPRGDAKDARP